MSQFVVCAFYRFHPVADVDALRDTLRTAAQAAGVMGTILVAPEGINGTLAGSAAGIAHMQALFASLPGFADLPYRLSYVDAQPFGHLFIKQKKEIVSMGQADLPIAGHTGTYVEPADWDELTSRDDVVVVDTRNDYECSEGMFAGAINPNVHCFRDFPAWVDANLDSKKQPNVAMYCTGGIRCEKATAFLRQRGFAEVYHLRGGILNYFEQTSNKTGRWNGTCFVFDERETVDPTLHAVPAQTRAAYPERVESDDERMT